MRESSCQTDPIELTGEKHDATAPQAAAAPAAITASPVPRRSQHEERATSKGSSTLIAPNDSKNDHHQVDVEKGTEAPASTNPDPSHKTPPPGPPGMEEDEAERNFRPKTLKFWAIMISVFMAMFLVALDRTIIGTAIPKITDEFRSVGDIGWYGSAYQLTTAASQLLFGRIYRFYNIKWYV